MKVETNIWIGKQFGGTPITETEFKNFNALSLQDATLNHIYFYFGNEEEMLDFKNQILWAWEDYLREKKNG